MNRRIVVLGKLSCAVLAGAVVFLSLLPTLGWTWHRLLPEHEHWLVGVLHEQVPPAPRLAANDCAECPADSEIAFHAPGFNAYQIAVIAVSLPLAIPLTMPDEFSGRVATPTFDSFPADLPRLDPPPKTR